ncbi:phosphonate C-P lyase system protein PhnH [Yersinia ruckeri]|nr:phosphonate C-P lyase system protein PhnH [Yersinia ruckeri]
MTLLSHFNHPINDSQQAFRHILKAMSEPGVQVTLPHRQGWGKLNPAATSLLLTLADQETTVYLADGLTSDSIWKNLRFHTGAAAATSLQQADFAIFHQEITAEQLAHCPAGNEVSPERSVTVVIQIASLHQGTPLRLRGAGIEQQRQISPCLPTALLNYLIARPKTFPMGIDFLFTCGENLMAIPQTTHLEVC